MKKMNKVKKKVDELIIEGTSNIIRHRTLRRSVSTEPLDRSTRPDPRPTAPRNPLPRHSAAFLC